MNNAGIERHGSLLEMPDEEFDRMIAVNLRGVFNGSNVAGPRWSPAAVAQSSMSHRWPRLAVCHSLAPTAPPRLVSCS